MTAPLRIVTGRQEPAPGSKRRVLMGEVKHWLIRHKGGGSYEDIATNLGATTPRVMEAVLDLHLFDGSVSISVPTPLNGNRVRMGAKLPVLQGELTQARHNATRERRQCIRLTNAADAATDPVIKHRFQMQAAQAEQAAIAAEALRDDLEFLLSHPTP